MAPNRLKATERLRNVLVAIALNDGQWVLNEGGPDTKWEHCEVYADVVASLKLHTFF